MPERISNQADLGELNRALQKIDKLEKVVKEMARDMGALAHQTQGLDYLHAPPSTNNIAFTWTGATSTLSWGTGFIKGRNATANVVSPSVKQSSAPSIPHTIQVQSGSIGSLTASSYYWLGWDHAHNTMVATKDVSTIFQNYNVMVLCQLFTGTAGQTGTAGGGGSQSGVDLSGARYKMF